MVQNILGLPSQEIVKNFVSLLKDKNSKQAIELVNEVYQSGYDLTKFVDANIEFLRQEAIGKQNFSLLPLIYALLEAKKELKDSNLPQLPLEMAIIKVCGNWDTKSPRVGSREKSTSGESVSRESEKVHERKVESPASSTETPAGKPHLTKVITGHRTLKTGNDISIEKIIKIWPEFLQNLAPENHSLTMILKEAKPVRIEDNVLIISVPSKFYAERIKEPKKYKIIGEILEKTSGIKLAFNCIIDNKTDTIKKNEPNVLDNVREVFEEERE
jgi:DNA polymerase III gamma/tau subunit